MSWGTSVDLQSRGKALCYVRLIGNLALNLWDFNLRHFNSYHQIMKMSNIWRLMAAVEGTLKCKSMASLHFTMKMVRRYQSMSVIADHTRHWFPIGRPWRSRSNENLPFRGVRRSCASQSIRYVSNKIYHPRRLGPSVEAFHWGELEPVQELDIEHIKTRIHSFSRASNLFFLPLFAFLKAALPWRQHFHPYL